MEIKVYKVRASEGHYLCNKGDDYKDRCYATEILLSNADDIGNWMEITEAEKDELEIKDWRRDGLSEEEIQHNLEQKRKAKEEYERFKAEQLKNGEKEE